jgi:regulator of replication initiation timing
VTFTDPEFQQRIKQADTMIENLKFQNAKLFVENRTMNSHLAVQNDRISFHESSADEQWRHTVDLRERNHLLHMQQAELRKKYEAHVAGLPNEQAYRQLLADLEHVQGQYRQAVSENTTLRFEVQRLTDQCIKHGLFVRQQGSAQPPSRSSQGSVANTSQVGLIISELFHCSTNDSGSKKIIRWDHPSSEIPPLQHHLD